jgi:hypothetical protein
MNKILNNSLVHSVKRVFLNVILLENLCSTVLYCCVKIVIIICPEFSWSLGYLWNGVILRFTYRGILGCRGGSDI